MADCLWPFQHFLHITAPRHKTHKERGGRRERVGKWRIFSIFHVKLKGDYQGLVRLIIWWPGQMAHSDGTQCACMLDSHRGLLLSFQPHRMLPGKCRGHYGNRALGTILTMCLSLSSNVVEEKRAQWSFVRISLAGCCMHYRTRTKALSDTSLIGKATVFGAL